MQFVNSNILNLSPLIYAMQKINKNNINNDSVLNIYNFPEIDAGKEKLRGN